MMRVRVNPFAIVLHNDWRLPRILHHAAHAALGLPVWIAVHTLRLPSLWALGFCVAIAVLDKCVWLDWRHRECHWIGLHVTEWPDFWSDLGLTMLGALLPPPLIALPSYYVLSLFNGT